MTDEEDHFHPAPETPAPTPDDGPPDGYEADWFKWRSRMNRRRRFQRQHAPAPRGEPPTPPPVAT